MAAGEGHGGRPLVLASSRGPFAHELDSSGHPRPRRAAGGFAATTAALMSARDVTWVATAMTDGDRVVAGSGPSEIEGVRTVLLALDPAERSGFYDQISNATLWFLHHGMFDLVRTPVLDRSWRAAWAAYEAVNERFASAIADVAPTGAVVLVQDYHLSLVAESLRRARPDLDCVHFHHTPFCGPNSIRVLPEGIARRLLEGLAAHAACGFHSRRWAEAFEACCRWVLGEDRSPDTFVAPFAPDIPDVSEVAASETCRRALAELETRVGDRLVIARSDRMEPSKNVVRGFAAFDELLEAHPELHQRVVFEASLYPSRTDVADYRRYAGEVTHAVDAVNGRWATDGWLPVHLDDRDDFAASMALLRRADVVLVNPIKDGLNLVCQEAAAVSDRDSVVCLSRDAGSWDRLAGPALTVEPYDIVGTAQVLYRALTMPVDERAERAGALREVVAARTPADWLRDQLAAVE